MEAKNIFSNQFCINCLTYDRNIILKCYQVKNEGLISILQGKQLNLCYICLRVIQICEAFVQNVQSNQIYLESYVNVTESTLETAKLQSQPVLILSNSALDVIDVTENDNEDESSNIVYSRSNIRNDNLKIEVKEELPLEYLGDTFEHSDSEILYKEEDDNPLISFKKHKPLILKNGEPDITVKVKKKKECINDYGDIKNTDSREGFLIIYISKEQCLEERESMSKDKKYISATYKCLQCVKWFSCWNYYDKHMKKHDKVNGEYQCDICDQRRRTAEKLIQHQRYHTVRYKCIECNLIRMNRLAIKDHYTTHHLMDPSHYTCSYCSKNFKRQMSLKRHINYAHKTKPPTECNYCNKSYRTKDTLKAHLFRKHRTEISAGEVPHKMYACDECSMTFKAPSQLRIHMTKHSIARNYYCVECDKRFKSHLALTNHLKRAAPHITYTELPFKCDQCEKRFGVRRDLERHKNRVHLKIRPHNCDKCDKAYLNLWSLNEHKRYSHEGHKRALNHPCPMCDKVFDRSSTMKEHIRTHTGERPYKCHKCPAQFSQSGILSTHMKLVHLKLTRDGRPKATAAAAVK